MRYQQLITLPVSQTIWPQINSLIAQIHVRDSVVGCEGGRGRERGGEGRGEGRVDIISVVKNSYYALIIILYYT